MHIFAAPRELVFKTLTASDLIPQWWDRRHVYDGRRVRCPTGRPLRYVSRDTNGRIRVFRGVFHLFTLEKIIKTYEYGGAPGHISLETSALEEEPGGKTRLMTQTVFQSAADREGLLNKEMRNYNCNL